LWEGKYSADNCVHVYGNKKMILVENIFRKGGVKVKENDGKGEFK
jgi:hypothetical protein